MTVTAKEARKSFHASLKAADADAGTVTALVSVFEVVDSYDEMIMPGAFKDSLERFGDDPIPILWNHDWHEMDAHLAAAKGEETDEGLVVTMQFDMDDPTSLKAFRLLKSGRIKEFSIGGFEPASGIKRVEKDGRDVWAIYEFELVEVSLVLRGANPDTRLIDVKSAAELVAATEQDAPGKEVPPGDEDHPKDAEPDPGEADKAPEDSGAFHVAQKRASALLDLIT
ncbi:HK97 family phage prohead protease [Microbacterium luteum]|uniref:HK97 family phage prohead protease n=1 Tax=Microbacterium luteum TaxID=2782167 RepID=UPI0018888027|nr:HK97 family phage prohead protease [Microbacterium luteum]